VKGELPVSYGDLDSLGFGVKEAEVLRWDWLGVEQECLYFRFISYLRIESSCW
jgi:hypothetical protein